jgi:ribosomal protein L23
MRKISDFLDKFKNIGLKESATKEAIAKAINELFGKELVSRSMIGVKGKSVFVKTSGVLKSEIILLKDKIIDRAKSQSLFPLDIEDIR